MFSPITLFVYDRYEHTKKTVQALQNNYLAENSDLIIFSDAAKVPEKEKKVEIVREYIKSIKGFKSIAVNYRLSNYGVANSIISGVTEVVNKYGRIIVLEDDMVTSRYFLSYMNDALDRYAMEDRVISIHGYSYPVRKKLPEAYFLPGADCWGWATWKRGWELFNEDGKGLLQELQKRQLVKQFDFNGSHKYSKMLKDQIDGNNDSWAIRWYASAFLEKKLTLYPGRSLVHNIGNDSSGTHCGCNSINDAELSQTPIDLNGIEIIESKTAYYAFVEFFRKNRSTSVFMIQKRLRQAFHKLFG